MKRTKRITAVVLAIALLISAVVLSVGATGGTLASHYATNPDNGYGKQATITIDGTTSDWSDDMLISTGAAWDVANNWKGSHENRLVDAYALYGAWDSTNLYLGMQFVNTTDTWANPGEQSLMENGKMGDMGLVLALSVDPSSTGMNGRIDESTGIWGIDMNFETHVDHLLYFHADLSGDPGLFTAVDSSGFTSYTAGLKSFTNAGINIKKADTNICSSIWGLNYSDDPDDVYDDAADWVDYKTFTGSKGKHNTTYDTFYEISIPLATLGINANYITQNGVGAMVLGSRGASGVDSVPFDAAAMLDNATGACGNDPSTSHEKDDSDTITAPLARIGAVGDTPTPTNPTPTNPTPTDPTPTDPTPTDPPVAGKLNINSTSNLFGSNSYSVDNGGTVTVKYELDSGMGVVNTQWQLSYDSSKLRLITDSAAISPNFNVGVNSVNNVLYAAGSKTSPASFAGGKTFVAAEFEAIGTGSATVNLNVEELSVGYLKSGVLNYAQVVENSQIKDISSQEGFSNSSVSGRTVFAPGAGAMVDINIVSDFFGNKTVRVPADSKIVTIDFDMESNYKLISAQWTMYYDPTVLSFNESQGDFMMPNVNSATAQINDTGVIKGNFSNIRANDFSQKDTFITATFKPVELKDTTVRLDLVYLGVKKDGEDCYVVEEGVNQNVSGVTVSGDDSATGVTTDKNLGDVNLDGDVDIDDVTLVQKAVAKLVVLTPEQRYLADVNDDCAVKIDDATAIQKFVAKLITSF